MKLSRTISTALLLAASSGASLGTAQIAYEVGIHKVEKVWHVEGRIQNPERGDVDYWFARWTAGAYHLADYGRFVKGLRAFTADGQELAVERVDESHFRIGSEGHHEFLVRYEADAISEAIFTENVIDVESNRITRDYAYVNPVSLFGFVPDRIDQPVTLSIELPEGWSAATILPKDEYGLYHAESYYRFEDSPIFMAPDLNTVELEGGGKPLFVTVHGASEEDADELAEGCRKIVEAGAALMRGLPYRGYHFLIALVPEGQGSGLEHSDSTLILVNAAASPRNLWGIIAHEFFHLWVAERIHVEAIHRPDYTRPLETETLWVNEGITEYVSRLLLVHAGLMSREEFLTGLAQSGRFPRTESSWTEVSSAATRWESMMDLMKWSMAMYHQGPKTIFAMDMEMRRATDGERGVIDLLHLMMEEYVEKDRGFQEDAMPGLIDRVSDGDLSDFYESFIAGPEVPDVSEYLDVIGYEFVDQELREVSSPTEAQLSSREDFFSLEEVDSTLR